MYTQGMSDLALNWDRYAPNGTNLWRFKIKFQLGEPKCTTLVEFGNTVPGDRINKDASINKQEKYTIKLQLS